MEPEFEQSQVGAGASDSNHVSSKVHRKDGKKNFKHLMYNCRHSKLWSSTSFGSSLNRKKFHANEFVFPRWEASTIRAAWNMMTLHSSDIMGKKAVLHFNLHA